MLQDLITKVENYAKTLWQGGQIDIKELTKDITKIIEIMSIGCDLLQKNNIEFPVEYINDATNNYMNAIQSRDDYVLADCLYYEWREIMIVFNETMECVS